MIVLFFVLMVLAVTVFIGGLMIGIIWWDDDGPAVGIVAIVTTLALTGLLTMGTVEARERHDRTLCERQGEQTERVTKFVVYSFGVWDCLVETDDGWLSLDKVVKVDD